MRLGILQNEAMRLTSFVRISAITTFLFGGCWESRRFDYVTYPVVDDIFPEALKALMAG